MSLRLRRYAGWAQMRPGSILEAAPARLARAGWIVACSAFARGSSRRPRRYSRSAASRRPRSTTSAKRRTSPSARSATISREAVAQFVARIDAARLDGATTRERVGLLFGSLLEGEFEDGPIRREAVGAFFDAAHGTEDAAQGEISVSDAIQRLLAEGGEGELPPGCSVQTFAEVVLGAIYSTTLEWIHRDDYDVRARVSEVGGFLVGLLPD